MISSVISFMANNEIDSFLCKPSIRKARKPVYFFQLPVNKILKTIEFYIGNRYKNRLQYFAITPQKNQLPCML